MNPPNSTPEMQSPSLSGRLLFSLSYNLINVIALIFCIHFTTIIRSGGPGGFLEVIIKAWILILSLVSFVAGIVLSIEHYSATRPHFASQFIRRSITVLLVFFAALGVFEACGDNKGYCRNWQTVPFHLKIYSK